MVTIGTLPRARALGVLPHPARDERLHGTARAPLRRILVATDGWAASDGALRVAAELAKRSGAAVEMLVVGPPPADASALAPPEHARRELARRREVAQLLGRVHRQRQHGPTAAAGWPLRLEIGIVPAEAARVARETGADLVVLGSSTEATRHHHRDLALRLACLSPVPVLVTGSGRERLARQAFVAVEDVAAASDVACAARRLLRPPAAVTLGVPEDVGRGAAWDAARARIERVLASESGAASGTPPELRTLCLGGGAAERLLSLAYFAGRELLAIPVLARELDETGEVERAVARLLHAAGCSVLLVPAGQEEGDDASWTARAPSERGGAGSEGAVGDEGAHAG